MRATVYAVMICECGGAMMHGHWPDRDEVECVNQDCKHLGIKYLLPTVELTEAPVAFVRLSS